MAKYLCYSCNPETFVEEHIRPFTECFLKENATLPPDHLLKVKLTIKYSTSCLPEVISRTWYYYKSELTGRFISDVHGIEWKNNLNPKAWGKLVLEFDLVTATTA